VPNDPPPGHLGFTEGEAQLGETVTLRYLEAGAGPLVLLLHGFPDFSYGWRYQLAALAAAGYRAVAPDLRGYNRSSKPRRVAAYDLPVLGADVAALVRALGEERAAAIVGHDWGGVIAWLVAEQRPELLDRLVILNAPHPAAFARELATPDQLARSAYVFFFQLPWLPERVLRAGGSYAPLLRALRRMVKRPGALTSADLARHRDALAQPGALTAALNYYRAFGRRLARRAARRTLARLFGGRRAARGEPRTTVQAPTLLLWGERDPALGPRLTEGLERWVPRLEVRRFPEAGHWVQLDEPDAVSEAIVEWVRARG
jgi:pimeloyl-ACP methyl ester carboxylesterase